MTFVRKPGGRGAFRPRLKGAMAATREGVGVLPATIPNLTAWFDASQPMFTGGGSEVASGSDTIVTWPDRSGKGAVPTPLGVGAKFAPTGMNGRRSVKFNADSWFRLAGFLTAAYTDALTIVVVAKTASGAVSTLRVVFGASTPNVWFGPNGSNNVDNTIGGVSVAGTLLALDGQDGIYTCAIGPTSVETSVNRLARYTGGGALYSTMSTDVNVKSGTLTFSGQDLYIGDVANSASFAWDGWISEVLVYNRELNAEERRRLKDYLSAKWGFNSQPFLCLAGNSLTCGQGSTGGATQVISASGNNLPSYLLAALPGAKVMVDAFPGRTTTNLLAVSPDYGLKFAFPSTGAKHVMLVWEITNELIFGSPAQDAASAYAKIVAYCQAARAAGYRVVIGTCLPRLNGSGALPYANFNSDRLAVNANILANYASFADGVVDFTADARLNDPTNTTYFDPDQVHLKSAGYSVASSLVAPVVQPLLGL